MDIPVDAKGGGLRDWASKVDMLISVHFDKN